MYTIVRRAALSQSTFLWEISAADVARACQPGQFVMVRLHDGSERIPLTIADYDRAAGTVTVVVQALGKSTREMADRYHAGDSFDDFVGPLGLPHRVEQVGHAAFVGGGLGVAPVYPLLRAGQAGRKPHDRHRRVPECRPRVLGGSPGGVGRRAARVHRRRQLRPSRVSSPMRLADLLASDRPDLVVAIGPLAMMRACATVTEPSGVPTTVSLNTIMVDGTGMCGSCRVSVGGRIRFACVDGPEFDAHEVDFAELTARQGRFRHEEDQAVHDYEHLCSLEQQLFADGRYVRRIKDLDPHQMPMPQRDPAARVRTFDEVNLGYSLHEALQEAERCLQCARPTCISGCPVAVDIPRFLRHLAVRDVDGALAVIHESNILPSVCGRVCPQETQCESQCVVGRKLEPVAIGRLERFVGDHGRVAPFTADPSASAERLGRVAIAGSGPAGLACAADLVRAGCHVKVFEGLHVIGGVLQYGIPAFRLPREIIAREVDRLVELGVEFETDKIIGATFTVEQLLGEMGFDAVFLAVGAGAPSFLGLPGELAGQVYSANELLTRVNLMGGDQFPEHDTPVPLGSKVVVIGAGNTAMDCLRVARRLGVPSVRCVYRRSRAEAGARVEELRHAEEEGVEYLWLHSPERILVDDAGDVRGLELRKMALGELDGRGRRSPVPLDELVTIECDTVVYALGTTANPIATRSTPGLALDDRGYVVADDVTQATSLPGTVRGRRHRDRRRHCDPCDGRRAAGGPGHHRLPPAGEALAGHGRPPRCRGRRLGAPSARRPLPEVRANGGGRRGIPLLRRRPAAVALRGVRQGQRGVCLSLRCVPGVRCHVAAARARGPVEGDASARGDSVRLRDRAWRPGLLHPRRRRDRRSVVAGAVRALFGHGGRAHGHVGAPLPRGCSSRWCRRGRRPGRGVRRRRPPPRRPGQPVPARHRVRAGGAVLRGARRVGHGRGEGAVRRARRRGAGARRPAQHRIRRWRRPPALVFGAEQVDMLALLGGGSSNSAFSSPVADTARSSKNRTARASTRWRAGTGWPGLGVMVDAGVHRGRSRPRRHPTGGRHVVAARNVSVCSPPWPNIRAAPPTTDRRSRRRHRV